MIIIQGHAKKEVEKCKKEKLEAQRERENCEFEFETNIDEIIVDDISECFSSKKTNLNLLNLKNVSMEADRYHCSDNVVASICNALLIDLQLITKEDKDYVITTMKVHNARKRHRKKTVCNKKSLHYKNIKALGFDGKKSSALVKDNNKKSKQICDFYTFTQQDGQYLNHAEIKSKSTSKNISIAIQNVIEEYDSSEVIVAISADGTNCNTGRLGGACLLTEKYLQRNLHWLICLLHFNELPLR